jgi:hypothetical protein
MATTTDRDAAIQQMLDQHVLMRYCRGVDRRDVELLSSCYHPDAFDDHVGQTYTGETVAQGLVDWMDAIMTVTTHNITTFNIEVRGDEAGSESYTTSVHLTTMFGEEQTLMSIARYVDRFERRNGEWKIANRLVVAEFSGQVAMQRNPFDSMARKDRRDPSYTVLG